MSGQYLSPNAFKIIELACKIWNSPIYFKSSLNYNVNVTETCAISLQSNAQNNVCSAYAIFFFSYLQDWVDSTDHGYGDLTVPVV